MSEEEDDVEAKRLHMQEHFQAEQDTLGQLLKLENEMRDFYSLIQKEFQIQKEIVERLWLLTQRYLILTGTGPCCKYPEVYNTPTEDVILREYNQKLTDLNGLNTRLNNLLVSLRSSCCIFEKYYKRLDMTAETPFIVGDAYHKPIAYFIELVSDVFHYIHTHILKCRYVASQMEPLDLSPLEEYKKLLEPNEDFEEYLMLGLTYCRCLRPKYKCMV